MMENARLEPSHQIKIFTHKNFLILLKFPINPSLILNHLYGSKKISAQKKP